MSEFKTRAEISSASEFIQYLEQLLSGSLSTATGINRPLERLAENTNALLQELLRSRGPVTVIGNFDFASSTLNWSSSLIILIGDPLDPSVISNSVASGSVVVPPDEVAYVVIDRTTDGAALTVSVASLSAFATLLSTAPNRLDYVPIGVRVGLTGVVVAGNRYLRDGYELVNQGFTDTQYGQQTELTLVRETVRENMNLRMTGGGDIYWDSATPVLSWSAPLVLEFPGLAGDNFIAAGSVALGPDEVAYVTLDRTGAEAGSVGPLAVTVVPNGSVPYTTALGGDDKFVIAIHTSADNRVYLADGSALSDGETIKLGGARLGVQWYYQEPGQGTNALDQIQDLSASVPAASYRVGSGELMVYRNGIKAIGSKAYWDGNYPGTGSLNTTAGNIESGHDYIEEDRFGTGIGTRILWLRDDGLTVGHPSGTHDPPLNFPDTDELIEAFVGVQGQAPTITIPDGVYGFDVVWTDYNGGATKIRTSAGTLVSTGDVYSQLDVNHLEIEETATLIEGGTAAASTWHYVYLAPGSAVGGPPELKLSAQSPVATRPGKHPTETTFFFLCSVYVTAAGNFRSFSKQGSRVTMLPDEPDAVSEFSVALGSWESVDLSAYLPTTAIGATRILLQAATSAGASAGDRVEIGYRQTDYPAPAGVLYAIKPNNSADVQFELEVISKDNAFEVFFSAADFLGAATSCYIVGYNEGRLTAGTALGA
jgi:hypothetical protein